MVNYANGKIYKLTSFQTDEIYIGSTTKKYLCQRFAEEKSQWRKNPNSNLTSNKLAKFDDCRIVLLELYPCISKDQLLAREGFYIRTMDCVNKNIPGRTISEWRLVNRESINQNQNIKMKCECGKYSLNRNMQRHKTSKFHINFINSQADNSDSDNESVTELFEDLEI